MVVMFMLHHMEKNRTKLSTVYDESFNDDKKKVREIFIREKIVGEYLVLKSIENDKEKIAKNKLSNILIVDNFYEKFSVNYVVKYEGIIMIDNLDLFNNQKNVFWKYHLGHCFILVCNDDENILMASNFLNILENFAKEDMVL